MIEVGSIYWLTLESDISHPHVVIDLDELNDNVTVCSITTNMNKRNMPGNVILEVGEGNLEKQSIVEVSKESTVSKSQLKDYIGYLSKARVDEILKGIGFINRSYLNSK